MAAERDFELLDDYLADRMAEGDRSAFEEKLTADPDLQQEYVIQKDLIEGIKNARIAELKAMLNKVPVPSGNPGNAIGSKIAIGTAAAVVVISAAYWITRDDSPNVIAPKQGMRIEEQAPVEQAEEPVADPQQVQDQPDLGQQEEISRVQQAPVETDQNQTSAGTEHSRPSLAKRPGALSAPAVPGSPEGVSSLEVKTGDIRYSFHYQLNDGKLLLYGPFKKDSCEVVVLNTEGKRQNYLWDGKKYYSLQESDDEVKPLVPVVDADILKKLDK